MRGNQSAASPGSSEPTGFEAPATRSSGAGNGYLVSKRLTTASCSPDEIFSFFKDETKVKAAVSYIFVNEIDLLDMSDRQETDQRMIP